MFLGIMTHEGRSSLSEEIYMPHTRINDGQLYLQGLRKGSRADLVEFAIKNSKKYRHIHMKKMFSKEATEIQINNPAGSYFTIDGEVFQGSDIRIKLLPGFTNLMGKPIEFTEEQALFKSTV